MDQQRIEKINNYKPSQSVLERMSTISLLTTVGPSAVGKSYVMAALCHKYPDQFKLVIDETTRPPRVYETEGVDFIFRKEEDVLADLERGDLVQAAIGPNGHIYSTRLQSYPFNATGVLALIPSAVTKFRELPIKEFHSAFIVPPSWETWQAWLARQAANSDWSETAEQNYTQLRNNEPPAE
jgi:guanylate kinase